MIDPVTVAFENLLRSRANYVARTSWINVDCPACGDKRRRGGFIVTQTGGFRYYCQNGGCPFHDQPTGWEPGSGFFSKRLSELFTKFGGSLPSLPAQSFIRQDTVGVPVKPEKVPVILKDRILPPASIPISTALETDPRCMPVVEWLITKRSEVYLYPEYSKYLYWSPLSPKTLRIVFWHDDRIIGYLDRDTTKVDGKDRFKQHCDRGYLFGQHLVQTLPGPYVIVVESPMDAILLRGVATRTSKPTTEQIDFLVNCGKTPIWVPDQQRTEGMRFIEIADHYKHLVSVPDWPYKDPGEAFIPMGVLGTIDLILKSKTNSYTVEMLRMKQKE